MPSSFPTSPSNGAKYTVGGTRYTYVSSLNRWTIDTSTPIRTPTILIFTSSTTWTVPANAQAIEAIVIGGGGGGGGGGYLQRGASGGGGGGLSIARYNLNYFNGGTSSISCYITIGAGGTGGYGISTSGSLATNGSNGGDTTVSFTGAPYEGRIVAGGGTGGSASSGTSGNGTALTGGTGGLGMWNGGQGGSGGYGTTSSNLAGSNASDTINTPTGGGGGGGSYYDGSSYYQGTGGSSGSGSAANISVFDLQPTLTTPINLSSTYTNASTGVNLYSPASSLLNNFYPITGPGTGGSGGPADQVIGDYAFYGGNGGLYGGGGGGGGGLTSYADSGVGGYGGDGAQGCVILTVFYGLGGA